MFTFSDEDTDLLLIKWHTHTSGYAVLSVWSKINKRTVKMFAHRVVLERMLGRSLVKGELTDHIDRDKTNNRRENLRLADKSINSINRDIRPDNKTGFVGVYLFWPKEHQEKGWRKRYRATIQRKGQKIWYSPYFKTPQEAHQARVNYLSNQAY